MSQLNWKYSLQTAACSTNSPQVSCGLLGMWQQLLALGMVFRQKQHHTDTHRCYVEASKTQQLWH